MLQYVLHSSRVVGAHVPIPHGVTFNAEAGWSSLTAPYLIHTSLQNEDVLRKAWDAEGSPFKGTPFDPSALNMGGGAGAGDGAPP